MNDANFETEEIKPTKESAKKPKEKIDQKLKRFFVFNDIKSSALMIKSLYSSISTDDKSIHNETFEQAKERLNLSATDIELSHKRSRIIFLSNLTIAVFIFLYCFYSLITAKSIFVVIYSLSGVGPIALFLVIAFRASFRCWQIKQQRLGGFQEFTSNYRLWWPTAYSATGTSPKKRIANRPQR